LIEISLSALCGFSLSVSLSVTFVIYANTILAIEMLFAPYDRMALDVRCLCGS